MDDALQDLSSGVYSVLRAKAPTLANGRPVPDPAPVTMMIQGVLQPANQVDLMRLDEGRRVKDPRAFYSAAQLFIQSDTNASDIITVGADNFEVSSVESWGSGMDSNYWRAVILRVGRLSAAQP
jgi:hypothetical protein